MDIAVKRDLKKLNDISYDVVVVGGGIAGAFVAWDASLRGLSVAVVDKGDFGAATSAASGKIIHGGLRYLQYGAIGRVRESLHERMIFQRIAPQFVQRIPFVIPSYKSVMKSKRVLRLGIGLYELLGFDKRNVKDPEQVIPKHRALTKEEVGELFDVRSLGDLTGGVLYYECQMHSPERLTLSVLLAAVQAGAEAANYIEVKRLIKMGRRVAGVEVEDVFTNDRFNIRARMVINASGPWTNSLLKQIRGETPHVTSRFSKGIHLVTKKIMGDYALALPSRYQHAGAVLQRGGRHLFIVPWRGHSLIGTTNVSFDGSPDEKMVTEGDIHGLIEDINLSYPGASLKREDVVFFYGGLYPDDLAKSTEEGYQGDRKDQIVDFKKTDGIDGLISVIAVKYTTARKLAEKTVDVVFTKLGYYPGKCQTDKTPIYGGRIRRLKDFLAGEIERASTYLSREITGALICNYGSAYREVLAYAQTEPDLNVTLHADSTVIKAQVVHAVREEMAQKLTDVVFRRTGLGTVGDPGESCLRTIASIMAKELNWNEDRNRREIAEARTMFIPA